PAASATVVPAVLELLGVLRLRECPKSVADLLGDVLVDEIHWSGVQGGEGAVGVAYFEVHLVMGVSILCLHQQHSSMVLTALHHGHLVAGGPLDEVSGQRRREPDCVVEISGETAESLGIVLLLQGRAEAGEGGAELLLVPTWRKAEVQGQGSDPHRTATMIARPMPTPRGTR